MPDGTGPHGGSFGLYNSDGGSAGVGIPEGWDNRHAGSIRWGVVTGQLEQVPGEWKWESPFPEPEQPEDPIQLSPNKVPVITAKNSSITVRTLQELSVGSLFSVTDGDTNGSDVIWSDGEDVAWYEQFSVLFRTH